MRGRRAGAHRGRDHEERDFGEDGASMLFPETFETGCIGGWTMQTRSPRVQEGQRCWWGCRWDARAGAQHRRGRPVTAWCGVEPVQVSLPTRSVPGGSDQRAGGLRARGWKFGPAITLRRGLALCAFPGRVRRLDAPRERSQLHLLQSTPRPAPVCQRLPPPCRRPSPAVICLLRTPLVAGQVLADRRLKQRRQHRNAIWTMRQVTAHKLPGQAPRLTLPARKGTPACLFVQHLDVMSNS